MAKKSAPTPAAVTLNKSEALTQAHSVQQLTPTLTAEVDQLVVENEHAYLYADALLGRIKDARAGWGKVWERIQEKTIQPIRQGLEELYSLNRDVDRPLETLYESVRAKMKAYKLAETKRLADEQAAKDKEAERLRREAEEKAAAAARATTPQLKGRLEAQAQRLAQQAEQATTYDTPQPVEGARSNDRKLPAWRIKSLPDFLRGIADGTLPAECILVNMPVMNRHFKEDPEGMKAWPGVEVYTDVQIVGR